MSDLAAIALALETEGKCVTEAGEVWTCIKYPGFRVAKKQAWKYASSHGKLMSADLRRVLEAKADLPTQYCRTSLPVTMEGSAVGGGTVPVLLHRVIAYTFLGPPPHPHDTVDHIDRDRSNNRVMNLRWASPAEQLNNRARRTVYLQRLDDHSMHLLDEVPQTKRPLPPLRHGDTIDIAGQAMRVHVEERKFVTLQHAPSRLGRPKGTASPKKYQALLHFNAGHSLEEVATIMHIARSTALSYVGQAAREASFDVLAKLRARLQLDNGVGLGQLQQELELLNWQMAQDMVTQADYLSKYQRIVAKHVPCLGGDWEVVKQVWRCLLSLVSET